MSHIVQIQTEVRDPAAIRAACGRLALAEPVFGETKLFSSSAVGWAVRLPDFQPIDRQLSTLSTGRGLAQHGERSHLLRRKLSA